MAFENQYIPRKARFQYDKNIYRQIEPGTFAYIRNYSGIEPGFVSSAWKSTNRER